MKFFTENRRIAAIVLSFTAIISIIGGTFRSAAGLTEDICDSYKDSGAASDMAVLLDSASQVIAVYKAVIGDGRESEAEARLNSLSGKAVPTEINGTDADALRQNTAVLYNALLASGEMTEAQKITAMKYHYDMLNAWTMLCENKEYTNAAERYNDAISSLPLRFSGMADAAVFG